MNRRELTDAMVTWWAERFMINDKREVFSAHLRNELDALTESQFSFLELYVDYDPSGGPLLNATRLSGVNCAGYMFSSDGVFSCRKSGTEVRDGNLFAKAGYGADWLPVTTAPGLVGT